MERVREITAVRSGVSVALDVMTSFSHFVRYFVLKLMKILR